VQDIGSSGVAEVAAINTPHPTERLLVDGILLGHCHHGQVGEDAPDRDITVRCLAFTPGGKGPRPVEGITAQPPGLLDPLPGGKWLAWPTVALEQFPTFIPGPLHASSGGEVRYQAIVEDQEVHHIGSGVLEL
jgi:hypothetical protein